MISTIWAALILCLRRAMRHSVKARKIFLDYLQRANELHAHPEWYNALTNNCTTNIAVSAAQAQDIHTRLDWRILLVEMDALYLQQR